MTLVESLAAITATNAGSTFEFAYVDESGNTGDPLHGGTRTYTLGCSIVPGDYWTDRLDMLVDIRRGIRDTYGIRMSQELKANYLLRSRGPLETLKLGDGQRRDIYQRLLAGVSLVSTSVVGIVIDKESLTPSKDPFETSWTYLLQRLRIRSESLGHPIILVHDSGEDDRVRGILRKFRRFSYAPGSRVVEARHLVEDPVPRDSSTSYFIQGADLLAYAAFRRIQPPPAKTGSVCSEKMWDRVSSKWMVQANPRRNDGIVLYPT